MQINLLPFNIELLILNANSIKGTRPVTSLNIFIPSTKDFDPNGLFSSEIFGRVGEERRNGTFSYIDLKVSVFHPLIFKAYADLKELYGSIIMSKGYAIWDESEKDFVKSTPIDGETGIAFFLKHKDKIVFDDRDSDKRHFNIAIVEKTKDNCMLDKFVIIPSGLRDYSVDDDGKPSEDEINTLYRKLLSLSNLVDNNSKSVNNKTTDAIRATMQTTADAIYEYLKAMVEGKKKLIHDKFTGRRIYNSTRNVITSLINNVDVLGSPLTVGANQTVCGLYQFLKTALPFSIFNIRNGFISSVFLGPNHPAKLVNKKTLRMEHVEIHPDQYDAWMTEEGLEKTLTNFSIEDSRHSYIEVGDHYLGLIYKGKDGTFKLMNGIDDLPDTLDRECVTPITYAELFYIAMYKMANDIPAYITRYPIAGYGSIYPSMTYLKTTVPSQVLTELDSMFNKTENVAYQFPVEGANFVNSMSPHPSHLARMTADFDGDLTSFNPVYTSDAINEVKAKLGKRDYYVDVNNKMQFSAGMDTINYFLSSVTG